MKVCHVFGKTEKDMASHSTEVWWIWPLNMEGINGTVSCSLFKGVVDCDFTFLTLVSV